MSVLSVWLLQPMFVCSRLQNVKEHEVLWIAYMQIVSIDCFHFIAQLKVSLHWSLERVFGVRIGDGFDQLGCFLDFRVTWFFEFKQVSFTVLQVLEFSKLTRFYRVEDRFLVKIDLVYEELFGLTSKQKNECLVEQRSRTHALMRLSDGPTWIRLLSASCNILTIVLWCQIQYHLILISRLVSTLNTWVVSMAWGFIRLINDRSWCVWQVFLADKICSSIHSWSDNGLVLIL